MDNVNLLKLSGLQDAGFNIVQIDGGWMSIDQSKPWVLRENQEVRKSGGLAVIPQAIKPGCMIPDPKKFPSGLKAFGKTLHSRVFKFGLYTSGEKRSCVS